MGNLQICKTPFPGIFIAGESGFEHLVKFLVAALVLELDLLEFDFKLLIQFLVAVLGPRLDLLKFLVNHISDGLDFLIHREIWGRWCTDQAAGSELQDIA